MKKLLFCFLFVCGVDNVILGMSHNNNSRKKSVEFALLTFSKGKPKICALKMILMLIRSGCFKSPATKEAVTLDVERYCFTRDELKKLNIEIEKLEKEFVQIAKVCDNRKEELEFSIFENND